MKKNYYIFIAGPLSLTSERDALKALVNDLNSEYEAKGADIKVEIKSFDNFKSNQDVYNQFIEQETDLVIFIFEGKPGQKTREEFAKAASSYQDKKRPEIILFIKQDAYDNEDVKQDIVNMVKPLLGDQFLEPYTAYEDLKAKAKQKIDHFITPVINQKQKRGRIAIIILSVLCFFLLGLSLWALFFRGSSVEKSVSLDSVPILFAGGGSVANFIRDECSLDTLNKVDVANYPNSIYANMPSSNAWTLLSEEYNRYMSANKNADSLKFRIVCLSASPANIKDLVGSCNENEFFEAASIVEYNLGKDTLIVYVEKDGSEKYLKEVWIDSCHITPDGLASLIKLHNKDFKFFSTSVPSGTCRQYQSILPNKYGIELKEWIGAGRIIVFNELSDPGIFNDNRHPYMIMGSKNYYSKSICDKNKSEEQKSYYQLRVCKSSSGEAYTKEMYLYFLAFKEMVDQKHYVVIPKPIYDFLNKTKIAKTERWKKDIEIIKKDGDSLILLKHTDKLIHLTK